MTCDHHNPKRIEWPGGYAVQTMYGSWTGYYEDRPGEVFGITACPVCLIPLHGRPPYTTVHLPAQAHSQFKSKFKENLA